MATLAAVNDTLLEVSQNTEKTSKGISAFVKYLEEKKRDELEAEREAKAARTKMLSQSSSSSSSKSKTGGSFLDKLSPAGLLGAGGLLGLGANVGKALLRRLPALGLIGFADEIADAILGDDFPKDFKDTVSRGITGAGLGMLLGRRFIPIFTALGLLATDENKKLLKDIGVNAKEKWDKFAENLEPVLGFLPSFDNIVKFIGGSVTKGLTAIKGFTESGFDSEEFKKNWGSAVGLLGSVAFLLMPGKFMRALKFLAKFAFSKKKLVATLAALAAGTFAVDKMFDGDGNLGVDDFAGAAGIATGGYLGFKAIKGLANRGTPTDNDSRARTQQYKTNRPGTVNKQTGRLVGVDGKDTVISEKDKGFKEAQKKIREKYPRIFGKSGILKFLKGFGPLAALSGVFAMSEVQDVLASGASEKEKKEKLGAILGTELNSLALGGLGVALGGLAFGPKGAVIGGGVLSVLGALAPNIAGEMLADFFMGGNPQMNESQKNLLTSLNRVRKKAQGGGGDTGTFEDISSTIGIQNPDLNFAKNDYNQRLKNNMYNMAGIGNAGITNVSTGNKVNSDNTTSNTNTNVSNTSVTNPYGVIDLQDQFGYSYRSLV
jgi:hypothetical protein